MATACNSATLSPCGNSIPHFSLSSRLVALVEAIQQADIPPEKGRTLIFANSPKSAKDAQWALRHEGYDVENMHRPELAFEDEQRILSAFRGGKFPILICSKVLSRGIDIPNVTHVVCFEFAGNAYDHLHQIGRTARLGAKGQAWLCTSLPLPNDRPQSAPKALPEPKPVPMPMPCPSASQCQCQSPCPHPCPCPSSSPGPHPC